MNYHQEAERKQYALPVGVIVVEGEQGAGKTSLSTAFLVWDYLYHSDERIREAQAHVNELNMRCGYKLKLPEHIYFSNIEIALKGTLKSPKSVKTHYVNTQNLGLPGGERDVQYFPRGSVVYISEADMLLYCQDWQKISKYIWNLIKFVRHNRMTIILDMQSMDRLGIQIRKLVTDVISVDCNLSTPARFFRLIKQRTTWYFDWAKPQKLEARQSKIKYDMRTTVTKGDCSQPCSFKYKGNIFEHYDSYSGEMYFLKGISAKGYAVQQHPKMDYSERGVEEYCKMLPLVMPDDKEQPKQDKGQNRDKSHG